MENLINELNITIYQMFLLETEMNECLWVQERLAAGDRLSVLAFLRRLRGTITDVEKKEMVSRILRDPSSSAITYVFRCARRCKLLSIFHTLSRDISTTVMLVSFLLVCIIIFLVLCYHSSLIATRVWGVIRVGKMHPACSPELLLS